MQAKTSLTFFASPLAYFEEVFWSFPVWVHELMMIIAHLMVLLQNKHFYQRKEDDDAWKKLEFLAVQVESWELGWHASNSSTPYF